MRESHDFSDGCGCGCAERSGSTHHHGHFHTGRGHETEARGTGFHRRFQSSAEQMAELEDYLKALEAEAQGARERLASLKAAPNPSE